MATYTDNYQLHQWVPEDDFLRTDFNTDFQKIDAALGAKAEAAALTGLQEELDSVQKTAERRCRLISGSYAGSGSLPRDINIGVAPRALLLSLGNNTVTAIQDGALKYFKARNLNLTSWDDRTDLLTEHTFDGLTATYVVKGSGSSAVKTEFLNDFKAGKYGKLANEVPENNYVSWAK